MASNPYVNKVQLANGQTLIDISSDTVTPNSLMRGYTAHDASGASITGTAEGGGSGDGYVWQDGDGYVHLSDEGGTQYVVSQLIAEEYDSTATYDVGDYCSYNGGFYVCSTAISTAEAWNTNHWTQVTVADELAEIKSQPSGGGDEAIYLSGISVASTGSHTYSVTGITADYVLVDWGFSNGSINSPPVNATVTTGAGTVTVNVTAVHTANATISPTFVKRVEKTYI